MTLAERLRAALARPRAGIVLETDGRALAMERTPAAVLIAITDRPEPGVILTLRQATLRRHAGQFAFPGGRIDPDDSGPVAAALREAREEIGLDPAEVEVIGTTDPFEANSGFSITPVVGVIPPDLPFVPHEAEVADLFEVPLAHLMERHRRTTQDHEGRSYTVNEVVWGERRIWGITAALIVNLSHRLAPAI